MRWLLLSLALVLMAAGMGAAYVLWPLGTAWRIREAVRSGDAEYLADKVEWSSVKRSLKPSMMQIALGGNQAAMAEASVAPKPGPWQRMKAYLGEKTVDKMIDEYVTPEGLPKLFEYGKIYRKHIKGEDETAGLPLPERIGRAWSRVVRAEFKSLTRFELEMRDRGAPQRSYAGVLELRGWEWKLTELTVEQPASGGLAAAAAGETAVD